MGKKNKIIQEISPDIRQLFADTARDLAGRGNQKLEKTLKRWLTERFEQGCWVPKNNELVVTYLEAFVKNHGSIITSKNLFEHQNIPHLYETVKASLGMDAPLPPTNILGEVVWIYEDQGLRLGMPRTTADAKKYGEGTKWCVAKDRKNAFWHYATQAPLLYIITQETKFCWSALTGEFRTASNAKIKAQTAKNIVHQHPILPDLLAEWARHLVQHNITVDLGQMPDVFLTQALHTAATSPAPETDRPRLTFDGGDIASLLTPTERSNLQRIMEGKICLTHLDKEDRTHPVCLMAVCKSGKEIYYVPEPMLTINFIHEALQMVANHPDFYPQKIGDLVQHIHVRHVDVLLADIGYGLNEQGIFCRLEGDQRSTVRRPPSFRLIDAPSGNAPVKPLGT